MRFVNSGAKVQKKNEIRNFFGDKVIFISHLRHFGEDFGKAGREFFFWRVLKSMILGDWAIGLLGDGAIGRGVISGAKIRTRTTEYY